ncbi:glutaredoxin family protein [Dasania sp. GY-MA-18]|uniref:Glutaredoxin family protein n=1 Tax=Dasania phycosphaerae TaxID=2950436 RepID=A0A9J6RJQ7_9GAMM|nr:MULTISPECIES: glutaredoxin family protein [Dasania]MCR8922003.1 glutaredoxin family protein [Dasania sp. GY-MA-18]MCZ0864431.1 glutaredoxin family protein [Dasania phycosphaerae]MCZ0868159.1 glutaredoxin family protein [Dasania phycosphaerae]
MHYLILLLALLLTHSSHAEIYKWTDEQGRVHFSDSKDTQQPVETVTLKINSYQHVSFESLGQANSNSRNVIMYSAAWCGYCKKAKQYFKAQGIAFTELDIDKNPRAKREYKALGAKGVPVILVGNQRMNGFSVKGFQRIYQAAANKQY